MVNYIKRALILLKRINRASKFGIEFQRSANFKIPNDLVINGDRKPVNLPLEKGVKVALVETLVDGLQRWRTASINRLLVTMFHEVYATGPPWASSFWLSPLQRNLAARLAQMSDHCLTSRQGYAKLLYELSHRPLTECL